jgi:hypothetical protein
MPKRTHNGLPVIICPLSFFDDTEIAGETADEIAKNLFEGTHAALFWRSKPKRYIYSKEDLQNLFRGHQLSDESKHYCRMVAATYFDLRQRFPQFSERRTSP